MKKIFAEGKKSTKATFRKDKDTSGPTKLNLSQPHTTLGSWQRPLRSRLRFEEPRYRPPHSPHGIYKT